MAREWVDERGSMEQEVLWSFYLSSILGIHRGEHALLSSASMKGVVCGEDALARLGGWTVCRDDTWMRAKMAQTTRRQSQLGDCTRLAMSMFNRQCEIIQVYVRYICLFVYSPYCYVLGYCTTCFKGRLHINLQCLIYTITSIECMSDHAHAHYCFLTTWYRMTESLFFRCTLFDPF